MNNRYLFELGTEEIPASMIASAMEQLKSLMVTRLQENQLSWENIETWSTPRFGRRPVSWAQRRRLHLAQVSAARCGR